MGEFCTGDNVCVREKVMNWYQRKLGKIYGSVDQPKMSKEMLRATVSWSWWYNEEKMMNLWQLSVPEMPNPILEKVPVVRS